MLDAAALSWLSGAPVLAGRRVAVLGHAGGLGRAVAQAAGAAGAEVHGIDADPAFDHVAALYRADTTDPAALDAAAAALPEGLDGLALFPRPAEGRAALVHGLLAPKRLAEALAPRLAPGTAIVAQAAPPHASWQASLGTVRAAAVLAWDDLDGFCARWGLDAEPALAPRIAGWGMLAWVMAHRWAWPGIRVNALTPAAPDGRLPPAIAARRGLEPARGTEGAALAAVFLLSPLSQGLTGANLAADAGQSAQIQTSLEGL